MNRPERSFTTGEIRLERRLSTYWRVTFDMPPVNIFGPQHLPLLSDIVTAIEMSNRPQTLNGLVDSPAGLASWMLDHDARSAAMIARVFDGRTEGLSRDDVIDNITLYWLTNTAVSSARLYWENKLVFFAPKHVNIPVAVSVFPDEIYAAPRSWAEKAYPKLIHYNRLDKGGHFAAWEQPALFSAEVRTAFRPLRQSI